MRKRKISLCRRITQAVCFVLLVYGAYIFGTSPDGTGLLPRIEPDDGLPRTSGFEQGQILWATPDHPVVETYPPGAICRFNPRGGLFKACFLHFLSENLTWRTRLKYLLPHITVFAVLAFLGARWWCGWVCPLGFMGDAAGALRRRMGFSYLNPGQGLKKTLEVSKYALAGSALFVSCMIGRDRFKDMQCSLFLPYCQICPARIICPLLGAAKPSFADFSTASSSFFTAGAWMVLGLFFAVFFMSRRVWCRVCPVGLFNSFFNRGGALSKEKDALRCNRCGICAESCPMGIESVYREKKKKNVSDFNCIYCLKCVELCPKDDCLKFKFFGRTLSRSRYGRTPAS